MTLTVTVSLWNDTRLCSTRICSIPPGLDFATLVNILASQFGEEGLTSAQLGTDFSVQVDLASYAAATLFGRLC